jgi:DNA-binding response OmpR family regulator
LRRESTTPIIMLTARDEETSKVLGLNLGADDYITKPFSFQELLARVRALLRRVSFERTAEDATVIRIGALTLDLDAHRVQLGDETLQMTQMEYKLLQTLMERAGHVVRRHDLMDLVWGVDWVGDTHTLDVHIRWLRQKIEAEPSHPRYIQTVRGVGYRFATPDEVEG